MSSKIKVGDRVRLTSFGIEVEGILEEITKYPKYTLYKVDGELYSKLPRKISEGVVEEKVREEKTSIDEDMMNALIS